MSMPVALPNLVFRNHSSQNVPKLLVEAKTSYIKLAGELRTMKMVSGSIATSFVVLSFISVLEVDFSAVCKIYSGRCNTDSCLLMFFWAL